MILNIMKVVKQLKIIDKFLKFLKTDRNTFFTYILTLLSAYIMVDRIVEMLFMIFTGVSVSYWGPIKYTLALACPVFAFLFSGDSDFAKSDNTKLSFLYVYVISLYVISISMVSQFLNELLWLGLFYVPNYVSIVSEFPELVKAALTAIALYLPLTTGYSVFEFLFKKVNDTKDFRDSILDYNGISLTNKDKGTGPYSCEIEICRDKNKGTPAKVPEQTRFESTLIVGASGCGKTTMVLEPMVARDIERKFFFKEISKEMGFTALRTGLAKLDAPYDNEYLNANFSLNMLTPNELKLPLYKAYTKKMLLDENKLTYKNLGITAMSPDYESISNMISVAENFGMKYNIIDPQDSRSLGMNPFIFDDPIKISIAISSVLQGMYTQKSTADSYDGRKEALSTQAIENLSILLKEMYPLLNDGALPTLEDMLEMLLDFDLVEDMCKKMEYDEELSKKYKLNIAYFKRNFYKSGIGRAETESLVRTETTLLDNLLRLPGVRSILCNRYNNIDFDKALANGELTFVCTRRGDLGATANKAFGLFFILLMQYSVLRRPGNEKSRIPHFFYIDEFPDFICESTNTMFTLYRKYRVGTIITAQNLEQLGNKNYSSNRQTILSNCITKMFFGGGSTPEDAEWWSKEFGDKRKWKFKNNYNTGKGEYDQAYRDIEWGWTQNFKPDKLHSMGAKTCAYKTRTPTGKNLVGAGKVDRLDSKYKETQKTKKYNFAKFTSGIVTDDSDSSKLKKKKFDYRHMDFTDTEKEDEIDPIKTDKTDAKFLFDNEDAIIVNLKKGNSN